MMEGIKNPSRSQVGSEAEPQAEGLSKILLATDIPQFNISQIRKATERKYSMIKRYKQLLEDDSMSVKEARNIESEIKKCEMCLETIEYIKSVMYFLDTFQVELVEMLNVIHGAYKFQSISLRERYRADPTDASKLVMDLKEVGTGLIWSLKIGNMENVEAGNTDYIDFVDRYNKPSQGVGVGWVLYQPGDNMLELRDVDYYTMRFGESAT